MLKDVCTPSYIFDIDALLKRAAKIKSAFSRVGARVCYAIKANPFLMRYLADSVDCFEVCSPGEFRICEKYGINPQKIVLSGVFKEESDIKRIVSICGAQSVYTIESLNQLVLLDKTAKENGIVLPVLMRLTCGNQFGMDRETVLDIAKHRSDYALDFLGIQFYGGTQKKIEKIQKEIDEISSCISDLNQIGFDVKRVEYGAGFKVSYFQGESFDEDEYIAQIVDALKVFEGREITLELGRFLSACCGKYYTSVVDLKTNCGVDYAIVDGGINHLNYYGQMLAMKVPYCTKYPQSDAQPKPYTVCGSLCTTADVIVKNLPLSDLHIGDVLCFENVGAYSVTEGIYLFLSRDMPKIYIKEKDVLSLVRDTFRTDILNS